MMTEGQKSSVDDSHGIKLGTHEDAYQNYHLYECWPERCKIPTYCVMYQTGRCFWGVWPGPAWIIEQKGVKSHICGLRLLKGDSIQRW